MNLWRESKLGLAVAIATACLSSTAVANEPQETIDCYDAIVSARVVGQIPSVYPDCDNCVVMRWPWFMELDIERVVEGQARRGRQLTLSVQHTYLADMGTRRWWLRRHSLGGFNLVHFGSGAEPVPCANSAPPADPYISPGPGKTLLDLLNEGRKAYGDHP